VLISWAIRRRGPIYPAKFFTWLLLQNRVWTADRLLLREWPNQYFCPLCVRNLETADHLFRECPMVCQVWTAISTWTRLPSLDPRQWSPQVNLLEWFFRLPGNPNAPMAKGIRTLIILVCWNVWRERNSRIFEGKEKPAAMLVSAIQDEARLWIAAGAMQLQNLASSQFSPTVAGLAHAPKPVLCWHLHRLCSVKLPLLAYNESAS
jgi:hypothetical protein